MTQETKPAPLPITRARAEFIIKNGRDGYSWTFEKPTHDELMTQDERDALQHYFSNHAKGFESRHSILHRCRREGAT